MAEDWPEREESLVKHLTIDGVKYACPFENAVRPLTVSELGRLEENILLLKQITVRVCVYFSPRWGEAIFDGVNRAVLGLKHGLEIPLEHYDYTDAEAAEQAVHLNLDRRQLTPEELLAAIKQVRAERIPRVAAKAALGKSLREIAAEEQVSPEQIRQDLAAAKGQRSSKRKPLPKQADVKAKALFHCVGKLLANETRRAQLRAAAESYGVPLSEDGRSWPALENVARAIRDLA